MKPLPEPVQAAFPCAPGCLPERPWRSDMTPARAAAYDAANPLPHPGYRAGQVWAAEDGESITILRAKSTRVWASADSPNVLPPGEFAKDYPYLMADPACPHLAPWSPAEEVKP